MSKRDDDQLPSMSSMEAAALLGLATGTVQRMFDDGDLQGWKTKGGHRRVYRSSVEMLLAQRASSADSSVGPGPVGTSGASRLLIIEDSSYYRSLLSDLLADHFPGLQVETAIDGYSGLAKLGEFRPQILLLDIMLPGLDGAALLTSLRHNEAFSGLHIIVVTALSDEELAPFQFALGAVPVIKKLNLVTQLPLALMPLLSAQGSGTSSPRV
jgi:excisionase family DNA binding protein